MAQQGRTMTGTIDQDGVLRLAGTLGVRPICPECHEPINLALDLTSFTIGVEHELAHARCLWRPEVFEAEQERAAAALHDETD
jgi:hypothetical protein